jgi:hypothetical protein
MERVPGKGGSSRRAIKNDGVSADAIAIGNHNSAAIVGMEK